jgi:hypothetical protein
MISYRVKYGVDSSELSNQQPTTIGAVRSNPNLRALLGYGDNINLLINGVAMTDDTLIPDGATVVVETAANQKA